MCLTLILCDDDEPCYDLISSLRNKIILMNLLIHEWTNFCEPIVAFKRHAVTVFDVEAERARERALERADRVRSSGRYHDHLAPRDRYADNRKTR